MSPCSTDGTVTVCRPTSFTYRAVNRCPVCKRRRRMAVTIYVWYASMIRCCGCGDTFSDGYRMPRPFQRGWRPRAIAEAKALWAAAGTRAEARAWLDEEMAPYQEPVSA